MALTTSEVARIKAELGFNVLTVGAEPYIGITILFEKVIQPYLQSGAATTSTTAVTEAEAPTPVALGLTDLTGFAAGDRVIVDVDDRQEAATIQSVDLLSITVLLSKPHSGTYPVTVEGGETMVRDLLTQLRQLRAPGGAFSKVASRAGIKKVDEVEFFGSGASGTTSLKDLLRLQTYYRNELAALLGVPNMHPNGSGSGGGTISPY